MSFRRHGLRSPAQLHLTKLSIIFSFGLSGCTTIASRMPAARTQQTAFVYNGAGACQGCPEDLAKVFQSQGYAIRYVKASDINADVDAAPLKEATVYVQPGGTDRLEDTTDVFTDVGRQALREFVAHGGRYVGVCAGAYLAGEWVDDEHKSRGFGLLDGVVQEEMSDPKPRLENVRWGSDVIPTYFQNGPQLASSGLPKMKIWGTYLNTGHPAAITYEYGNGQVALVGPHPEANAEWFKEDHLPEPPLATSKLVEIIHALEH